MHPVSSCSWTQDEEVAIAWNFMVSGWRSEHKISSKNLCSEEANGSSIYGPSWKVTSPHIQSVGWECLQGKLEKRKRKWIIVNKWYNFHASWGRYCYNSLDWDRYCYHSLDRDGNWGTEGLRTSLGPCPRSSSFLVVESRFHLRESDFMILNHFLDSSCGNPHFCGTIYIILSKFSAGLNENKF